jgi:hypothetical protein
MPAQLPSQPFQLTQPPPPLPPPSQSALTAAAAGSPTHAHTLAQVSGTLSGSSCASDFARAPPALVQPPGAADGSQQLGQLLQALVGPAAYGGGPLAPSLHRLAGEHLLQQAAAAAAQQQQQATIAELVRRISDQAAGPGAPPSSFTRLLPPPVSTAAPEPAAQLLQLLQGGACAALGAAAQPAPQAAGLDAAGVLQQLAALNQPQLLGPPAGAPVAQAQGQVLLAQLAQLAAAAPQPGRGPAPAAPPLQQVQARALPCPFTVKEEGGGKGAAQLLAAIMGTLVTAP